MGFDSLPFSQNAAYQKGTKNDDGNPSFEDWLNPNRRRKKS